MPGRWGRWAVAMAASASSVTACGLLVDTEGLVGARADAAGDAVGLDTASTVVAPDDRTVPDIEGGTDGGADVVVDQFVLEVGPPPATCDGGFSCLAKAPVGWTGPFALYAGNPANAPSCGGAAETLLAHDMLGTVAPAQCAACTCGDAIGAACGKYAMTGQSGSCTKPGSKEQLLPGTCYGRMATAVIDGDSFQAAALEFGLPPVDGGTCAPAVAKPTPVKPEVPWNVTAVGCNVAAPSTPGCSANEVCAANTVAPFDTKQCILQVGDVAACPGAPYSQRRLFYQGTNDTRDCGSCACGAPNAATCTASVLLSTDPQCGSGTTVTAPGCYGRDNGQFLAYFKMTASLPAKVTCPASGGAPTGTATPSGPVTVCCMP